MPRNTIYRKSFRADNNQYWRLEIIPAQQSTSVFNYVTAPIVALDDETVLGIGELKYNYVDDLPFGLQQDPVLEVEFNLAVLPTDLKDYLTQSVYPGSESSANVRTNLAYLYSSLDNITWSLVYIGVQTPSISQVVTIGYNLESNAKISFQPILPHVLSRCKWTYLNRAWNDASFTTPTAVPFIYNFIDTESVDFPTLPSAYGFEFDIRFSGDRDSNPSDLYVYMFKLRDVFEAIRFEITLWFRYVTFQDNSQNLGSNFTFLTTQWFEWTYDRYFGADAIIQPRTAQTSVNDFQNRLGSYLGFTSLWVPGIVDFRNNITDWDDVLVDNTTNNTALYAATIFGSNASTSLGGQFKTFAEFIKALHESTCAKSQTLFSNTSGVIKMTLNVFGALEQSNSTIDSNLNTLQKSISEDLEADIGYTSSAVQTSNPKCVAPLAEIPQQSPFISSLATVQSFNVKTPIFNWDTPIPDPLSDNTTQMTSGKYQRLFDAGYNSNSVDIKLTFPFTTLYYQTAINNVPYLKITEYVKWGDTNLASPRNIYMETSGFVNNDIGSFKLQNIAALDYLPIYRYLYTRHQAVGTARQTNAVFLNLLANSKNWKTEGIELINYESHDLEIPNRILGARITDGTPTNYTLPTTGIITNVAYNIIEGKYTLSIFHPGLLYS